MNGATFTKVCSNETRIDYRGMKFLLVEQARGFGGIGRAIQLYALDGFKREHIKEIGWTRDEVRMHITKRKRYYLCRLNYSP